MIARTGLLVLPLLVMLSGAVCAETPPEHQKGNATAMDSPFEIRATFDKSLTLKAALVNRSGAAQWAFHDRGLQPSALELVDAKGVTLQPEDQRAAEKYDNTIRRGYYKSVAPGASLALFQARAAKQSGRYTITWGPFAYNGLAPGRYHARIRWTSAESTYVDDDGGVRTLAGVWRGTVTSGAVEIALP